MSTIKERLGKGETVHGCWLNLGSTLSAEMVSRAGFDWVLIDLEHGSGSEALLVPQLQALREGTVTPLVRLESYERARVKRALDAGVQGIMFPQIQNAEEAGEAIANMYYPPRGNRGLAKMIRATQFGIGFDQYYEFTQTGLLGIIQIETAESLNHLDEIAAIEGVDVLFLGPSDLSLALGILGQWEHPRFVEAVEAIGAAAKKAGKIAGTLLLNLDHYGFYQQHGYRFLASGSDMTFLNNGARHMAKNLNDLREKYQQSK